MLIYNIEISGTASGGTFNFNTKKFDNAILSQIIVKSALSTTTFNFKMDDEKNHIIFETDVPATGILRREVHIPLKSIHTVTVQDASAEDVFTGKLMVEEC